MRPWYYLALASLGLLLCILVASFQPAPGYMDADYYYAGGLQLVSGNGFTEPYIWNYLDSPEEIPHPSHGYWMPLASLLAAAGAITLGADSWWAARSGFLLVSSCLPPITAAIAWKVSRRRDLAWTSGLFAVFSGYYLVYLPTTDTFGIYMVLGGVFFLFFLEKGSALISVMLGMVSALMHLARADGIMWLMLAVVAAWLQNRARNKPLYLLLVYLLPVAGYLVIMSPWLLRNLEVFGSPLSPGGSRMLWLISYDQLFAFPPEQINFEAWKHSGIGEILKVRGWALGMNLVNAFSVQGGMFIWPLGCLGVWHLRRQDLTKMALLAWGILLFVMTVIFPFAGARGGFIHSGAALQTVWWVFIPIGLQKVIEWGVRKRGWVSERSLRIFPAFIIGMVAVFTIVIAVGKLGIWTENPWGIDHEKYSLVGDQLTAAGYKRDNIVMVSNPPGFWLSTGTPAISIPDGDVETVLQLAEKYNADVLVLEQENLPRDLQAVYDQPDSFPGLMPLFSQGDIHVFAIQP